ncbi:apolipoprotein D-like [Drosophila gunungcola]|uniref:apolipoprotein D-like n=1 Tax=Drosophila gunungcola TaxID=103775 RepID=UPI0022DE98C0|nr:apolipoprotein D-like [Drosophila gunungcola]
MNHRSSLCLLILLVVNGIWLGNAQIPFPGKCPDVKVVDTFDVEAYMGVWYEYSKYPFAFEIGKKCIYANYGVIDNSTVSVLNAAINQLTGNPSNVTGKAKLIAPGQLAVAFYPGQSLTKANYLVLGTDYESYAVVYSCTSLTPLANFKIVWILTREREPSTETIDAAKKILDDNEISQAFLIDTTQKNCPELEGNGTELAGSDELDVDHFVTTVVPNAIGKA